jgi:hypothetical protein
MDWHHLKSEPGIFTEAPDINPFPITLITFTAERRTILGFLLAPTIYQKPSAEKDTQRTNPHKQVHAIINILLRPNIAQNGASDHWPDKKPSTKN